MTSIPASRNARAITFAPRSCPSRPGFATTTLIFPAIGRILEDRRLAPDAPHIAEGVAHLAHRDVGAGAGDDRLHQVRVTRGGAFELRERRLDRTGVPPRADALHPLDLLLLERRVDAEDLELRLIVELVSVDADDHALLLLDL